MIGEIVSDARGKPLTQGDLIRNYFFMKIHVDRHNEIYSEYWKPIQDGLLENLTEFIRHYLMRKGNFGKKSEVYYTLIQEVQENNRDVGRIAKIFKVLFLPSKSSKRIIA